ncbi:MAG: ABC transporter permease [Chloroflexota bacterium]|nr:ABC transporter permease [Chloroflexota bacterium]
MPALPRIVVQRLALIVGAALAASIAIFAMLHLSGDPLAGLLPPGSSPEATAALRQELGLDRPLVVQLVDHVAHTVRGDFGVSWRTERSALATIFDRLPATLLLTGSAVLLAVVIGGALGVAAARWAGRWPGRLLDGLALAGQAIPAFWLGTLFIILFAVEWRLLPASGSDGPKALVLPALTLAAYPGALIARLLRSELLVARRQPFAQAAAGKGLPPRSVWLGHLLPNAALPAVTYVGVHAGFLLSGAVVVESVFAYPGVSQVALQAANERDIPVVHAFVVVVAILVGMVSLLIDVLTAAIDPRLRVAVGGTSDGR